MDEDEFVIDPTKKRRKFTKDDAIYGVFKGYESPPEDPVERKKYSKPVGFVSSTSKDEEDEDDEMDYRPQMGFSSFGVEKTTKSFSSNTNQSSRRSSMKDTSNIPAPDYGIGAKLLQKQGWKPGEGLGKEKKGMSKPIEVKVRPKTQGLGFGGDERTQQQIELDEGPAGVTKKVRAEGWKRRGKKREKKVYKLPTDVELPQQKVTITDMRGEQPKTLSSLADMNEETITSEFLPELQHNISVLVNQREAEILTLDRKKISERNYIEKLLEDKKDLEVTVQAEADKIKRIEEIMAIIANANEKIQTKSLSLESLAKIFRLFQHSFSEEYKELQLHSLASSLAAPLLRDQLEQWKPLATPSFAIKELQTWKELMQPKVSHDYEDLEVIPMETDEVDVYTQLICDLILPKFRNALTNEWDVRSPENCLQLLETWEPLLPLAVMENILDQLIFPKLSQAVEGWNPKRDTVPIHRWLHPWLSLLRDRLDTFYPTIRQKFSLALREWHAGDSTAHTLLSPWNNVFDNASMENLLRRSIVPKISDYLRSSSVNPGNQDLRPFKSLMLWNDVFPLRLTLEVLEEVFFPQWHQALYSWLSQQPNLEEVSQWYSGWKQQFPESLYNVDRVRLHFNHALHVIDSAVSGKAPPPLPSLPPLAKESENVPAASKPKPKPKETDRGIDDMSFKEVVATYAESNGFLLIPSARRHEGGQQIYHFGNIPIILAKDIVYRQEKNEWKPTALEDLLSQ